MDWFYFIIPLITIYLYLVAYIHVGGRAHQKVMDRKYGPFEWKFSFAKLLKMQFQDGEKK